MQAQKAAEVEMESDLRSRVVALEQQAAHREQRLVIVENWQRQQEVTEARRDEKWTNLEGRLGSLNAKIDAIADTLKWVSRSIFGGIILGVLAFIFRGGMGI